MLYTDCTVTINGEKSVIDRPVVLYRGDKEVEIKFYIMKNTFYQSIVTRTTNVVSDVDASFSQLVIRIPEGEPIFSAVTPVEEDGAIIFKFTAEMIDEVQEVGSYDFQIRLLDENKTSRATIPPVIEGIKIKEPIAIESEPSITNDSNEVNVAQVNEAIITTATQLPAFDEQGNYIETTWTDKMLITDAKLNKIEDGITGVNEKIANLDLSGVDLTGYAKTEDIPTRVSQLTNDSNYVNTTQMNEAIANVTGQTIVEPQELDMPKVFFYGNALPTNKTNVNLTMDYVSNTTKFSSYIKLKCQGNSSMSYPKKNFTINMYSDEARETKLKKDFKGWGAQSKFCLKANYVDTTHTRNLSGARIAYDMVASRPDSEFKQQLLQCPRNGAVDGFPIKLYFNGEFYGIYTWNIPKDTWMFNMDKSNPNHIVLCAEKNTDGNSSAINSCQFRQLWTNGDGQDWSVEVGTMSEDLRTKFNRVINFVMTATDQEFHDNIGEYFDLYSLLDYYCFTYLTCHLDGLAKNMLMVTYDGVIWGASLYDMDSIYGVSWNGGSFVSPQYQCPEQYQEQFSRLWVRIEQCFGAELYARYLELRQGALSLSNIIKHVEEIYDVIPDRVFADEKAKWTSLPNVSSNTMTRFRNYMRDRAVYVDAQMQEIGTPQSSVECTGISLDKNTLTLGVVEGGADTSNLGTNLLEGAEWLDGQLNTANGAILTGTDKYTKINVNTPGKYTLSSTKGYTYKKVLMYSIDDIFMYSIGDSNDTNDIALNILEPCIIRISVFPNNLEWDSTTLSFIGVNFNEAITNKDVTHTLTTSDINVRHVGTQYVFAELYLDREYGNLAIGKYDGNNYKLLYKSSMAQDDESINSLINMNNLGYTFYGIWNGKSFLYTALPIAYGTTADEILANMTSTTITINSTDELAKLESTGGTTSEKLSEQLTATVTPSNCTQPVVWSVSPTGIVTVDNGLVTAVANGKTTVTATCGTQSANCAVTVSGMSESGGGNTGNYVTDNLYAYYDLTQLSTEATTVEDLSGNNNTFNVVSGTLTKDDLGGLIYNNNNNDNSPHINSATFNPQTAEASIEYTFKYTGENNCTNSNNYPNRTCGINGDNGQGYYCWVGGYGYVIFKNNNSIATDVAMSSTLVNGEYYHVVCTFGESEVKIYLNGELLATHTHNITSIPSNSIYHLGNSNSVGAPAQVLYSSRFYNKVLSQDEVTQNYTYEFTKLGLISGGDTGDYTDISYIESTGTQYINTHIVPTLSTKIELVAEMSASKTYDHIFGSDNFMKAQWSDDTGTAIEVVKKNGQNPVSRLTLGKHTYIMDMADTANAITIDGINYGANIGHVESTTNSLLLLSGYKNDGSVETEFCGIGKIYSCKIYYEDTLVANMKPILTNGGTYGLLDTVNNTFYGSEVGSFTGGSTPSGEDTGIYATAEYAITEPRTFNGTSDYIDTGIKLFDTAKDFAVFVDYTETGNVPEVNQATIFHCLHEERPYRGLCLMQINTNGSGYMIGGQAVSTAYLNNIPSLGNHKYLIQFTNGTIASIKTIDTSNNIIDCTLGTTASSNPYVQVTENLLLGCYQDTSGNKDRFWSGTINKFGVWYKQLTENEINQIFGKNGGDSGENTNLVFQVNSTSMNTVDNTLTDNIAGISATLVGNPTVSGNQIAFTASDTFSFDISSLNLTSSNRTFRIKFTPTTLDTNLKNVIGIGSRKDNSSWMYLTSCYVNSTKLILQHGRAGFTNHTVGSSLDNYPDNRLSTAPVTGQEYELVISEHTDGNVRWFIDGTLVQNGTTMLRELLYIHNAEGNARFIGNYSLIEIYNGYCNDYTGFTNMINNA